MKNYRRPDLGCLFSPLSRASLRQLLKSFEFDDLTEIPAPVGLALVADAGGSSLRHVRSNRSDGKLAIKSIRKSALAGRLLQFYPHLLDLPIKSKRPPFVVIA